MSQASKKPEFKGKKVSVKKTFRKRTQAERDRLATRGATFPVSDDKEHPPPKKVSAKLSDQLPNCKPFKPLTPKQKLDMYNRGVIAPVINDDD